MPIGSGLLCPYHKFIFTLADVSYEKPNKIFLQLQKPMSVVANHVVMEPPVLTELTHSHVNVYLGFEVTIVQQVSQQILIS